MPAKAYKGRLAFDPDSGFHTDEKGKNVVTADEGKSWQYAAEGDPSHIARYEQRRAEIDTTANAQVPEPHHFEVQGEDPHFGGVLVDSDHEAATVTGHTDSWKEQK